MNRALPTVLLAGLAVALSAGSVLAGRGGGGGFQGGGPPARRALRRVSGAFRRPPSVSRRRFQRHGPAIPGPHAVVQRATHRFPAGHDAPALPPVQHDQQSRRRPTGPSPASSRHASRGPALARQPWAQAGLGPPRLVSRQLARSLGSSLEPMAVRLVRRRGCLGRGCDDSVVVGILVLLQPLLHRPGRHGRGDDRLFSADRRGRAARAIGRPGAAADEASQLLDAARDAFLQGNYRAALSQANRAIAGNPNDPLPHEFRSLACFALKQYKEAAAGAYAVLSAGPGWDWTTLSSFYPDIRRLHPATPCLGAVHQRTSRPARRPVPLGLSLPDVRAHRRRGPTTEGGRATEPERPVVGATAGFARRAAGSGTGRTRRARRAGQAGGRRQPGGRLDRPGNRTAPPSCCD